jgi:hypothetical protein
MYIENACYVLPCLLMQWLLFARAAMLAERAARRLVALHPAAQMMMFCTTNNRLWMSNHSVDCASSFWSGS